MQEKDTNTPIPWGEVEQIYRSVWKLESKALPKAQLKLIEHSIESGEPLVIQEIEGGNYSFDFAGLINSKDVINLIVSIVLPLVIAYRQEKRSMSKKELEYYFSSLAGKGKDILSPKSDKLHDAIYKDQDEEE